HPVVADVEAPPAGVDGDVVVAVARQAAQPGVAPEGVAAGGVRTQPEEVFLAQVVEPGPRRVGPGDDVFARRVVEVAVRVHACTIRWEIDAPPGPGSRAGMEGRLPVKKRRRSEKP